ncbi:MAG: hypothetical protein AAF804_00035, partial [Bacteroidota bacterium]
MNSLFKRCPQAFVLFTLFGINPSLGQSYDVPLFERGVNLSGWGENSLHGLVVDAADNVYAAGYFFGQLCVGRDTCINSSGEADMFIVSFDPVGNLRWVRSYGGLGQDKIMDMKLGPDGYLYLAGGFSQTVWFDTLQRISKQKMDDFIRSDDACWMRMDTTGQLVDLHVVASTPWAEMIHTISVAANGRVAIGGEAVIGLWRSPTIPSQLLCTDDGNVCLTMDTIQVTSFFLVSYDES